MYFNCLNTVTEESNILRVICCIPLLVCVKIPPTTQITLLFLQPLILCPIFVDAIMCNFQADVCHAYQVMKKGGLKDENIIVFMYDDIAYNPDNPRPGIIINNPQGEDVYAGVPKV